MTVMLGQSGALGIEGAVSYWPLAEESGTRYDAVGPNDLGDNSSVTQEEGVQGIGSKAARFTRANNEFLDLADASQVGLDIEGNITITAWVYVVSFPAADMALVAKSQFAGDEAYHLYINSSDILVFEVSADGAANTTITASTFGALSIETWYFICARYDGANIDLRVNATDQASVAHTTGIFDSTGAAFQLGAWNNAAFAPLNGRLAHVGIWPRALEDGEVSYLYNSGRGRFATVGTRFPSADFGQTGMAGIAGAVSIWPLDEASGDALDIIGNNHLTDTNGVTSIDGGHLGRARHYERASSQYHSTTDAAQVGLDITGNITISAWVYLDSTGATQGIVSKWDTAPSAFRSYLLNVSAADRAVFTVSNDGTATTAITDATFGALSTDTWYFVCARYDGANLDLRINTTDQASVPHAAGIFDGGAVFVIGANQNGANHWLDGSIQHVGVWPRALSDNEVTHLYNGGIGRPARLTPRSHTVDLGQSGALGVHDPVSFWPLNEASGDAYDAMGNNTLTDTNSVTSAEGLRPRIQTARHFDDTNLEYLVITDAAQTGLDITGHLTITAWTYLDTLPSIVVQNYNIVAKWGTAGQRSYFIQVNTSDIVVVGVSNDGTANSFDTASTFGALSVDTWYFVCMRYDGTNLKVSVNTVEDSISYTSGIHDGNMPFQISGQNGTTATWDGRMQDIGIWPRALSDGEVSYLYNGGRGRFPIKGKRFPSTDHFSAGVRGLKPLSYWPLDEFSGDALDVAGGNLLTDNGGVTSGAGHHGRARQYTLASTQYHSITDGSQVGLDITGHMTISGWIYLDQLPSVATTPFEVITKWGPSGTFAYRLLIETADDKLDFRVSDDTTTLTSSIQSAALTAGTWYFICARYNGANLQLRVDTTDATPVAHTTGIANSTALFGIGYYGSGGTRYFDGRIQHIGIWPRALADDEVTFLYNLGKGRFY